MRRFAAYLTAAALLMHACSGEINITGTLDVEPSIFPDYSWVTIPTTIAPLNFRLEDDAEAASLLLEAGGVAIRVKGPEFRIPEDGWKKLLASGDDVKATIAVKADGEWKAYKPFDIFVSPDEIDPYITYRLIEPAYETWDEMGIWQRRLGDYTQTPVITNSGTGGNCMNCHSFSSRNPDRMVFHMRANNGGTYVINDGKIEKLNTKTPETLSAVVYPQWSADGRLIAFSVNDIWQVFHSTSPNRIEVYDTASDIVIYDVEKHELASTPLLMQENVLETYPTFSPDGRTVYFCSSPRQKVPEDYRNIRYSICSIPFDPETISFGDKVDTLYNARLTGKCATFPRISPDGRWLMFTQASYGCFSIWHKDADLYVLDLENGGEMRCLDAANSNDVESYHSWSGNSRWFVFSSRRIDGLYTRPYIAHIDEYGNVSKPFILPQKESTYYHDLFKSYNIPEFTTGKVSMPEETIARTAVNDPGIDLTYRK